MSSINRQNYYHFKNNVIDDNVIPVPGIWEEKDDWKEDLDVKEIIHNAQYTRQDEKTYSMYN